MVELERRLAVVPDAASPVHVVRLVEVRVFDYVLQRRGGVEASSCSRSWRLGCAAGRRWMRMLVRSASNLCVRVRARMCAWRCGRRGRVRAPPAFFCVMELAPMLGFEAFAEEMCVVFVS